MLETCSLRLVILDETRKIWPNYFLHWKTSLFQKNFYCSQEPLRCYRNDLMKSTVIIRTPFGTLYPVSWGFSHSIKREKIGQILLSTGMIAFFLKNLCFQQTLRSKTKDLLSSEYLLEYLVEPVICCLRSAMLGNTR